MHLNDKTTGDILEAHWALKWSRAGHHGKPRYQSMLGQISDNALSEYCAITTKVVLLLKRVSLMYTDVWLDTNEMAAMLI